MAEEKGKGGCNGQSARAPARTTLEVDWSFASASYFGSGSAPKRGTMSSVNVCQEQERSLRHVEGIHIRSRPEIS
jgi:hypothetical protein